MKARWLVEHGVVFKFAAWRCNWSIWGRRVCVLPSSIFLRSAPVHCRTQLASALTTAPSCWWPLLPLSLITAKASLSFPFPLPDAGKSAPYWTNSPAAAVLPVGVHSFKSQNPIDVAITTCGEGNKPQYAEWPTLHICSTLIQSRWVWSSNIVKKKASLPLWAKVGGVCVNCHATKAAITLSLTQSFKSKIYAGVWVKNAFVLWVVVHLDLDAAGGWLSLWPTTLGKYSPRALLGVLDERVRHMGSAVIRKFGSLGTGRSSRSFLL